MDCASAADETKAIIITAKKLVAVLIRIAFNMASPFEVTVVNVLFRTLLVLVTRTRNIHVSFSGKEIDGPLYNAKSIGENTETRWNGLGHETFL